MRVSPVLAVNHGSGSGIGYHSSSLCQWCEQVTPVARKKKENIRLTMRKMTEHTVTGKIATHHLHELYAADPDQPASMMIKQALSILILSQN